MNKLLQLLQSGHTYSRAELVTITGLPDRTIRKHIHDLRKQGHWIVNGEQGGYKLTEDPAEWNAFCHRERKRALNTFRKAVEYIDGQISI